jgi:rfaE bifunctional protein kinase chain/domain/rfaE bifunctional protein nucleotidyltransferase chain/domain
MNAVKTADKIVSFDQLAHIVAEHKRAGRRVVHCHGVFDLLHIGHIRYFEQAHAMGDVLVVTLTPDIYVDKGPHRPAFPENLRAESLASLSCIDYVAVNQWPTAEETLRCLRPDVYVKGSEFRQVKSDMTGKMALEEKVVREIGAQLAFTEDIVFSSTRLINTYLSLFPQEVQEYLDVFRQRHKEAEVTAAVDAMQELRVLVIGDAIIDEYVYCQAIGKSSKDPVLAMKYQSEDRFAGGVLAVANHVANFASRVELVTVLGRKAPHEEFIRSKLNPAIATHFFYENDVPTVSKRRYMESDYLTKLLEVYAMDERELSADTSDRICDLLQEKAQDFDVVLVADFGHGAISRNIVKTLCNCAPFLAINTQANAGNRGFHTVTRYPRADYACIAEHEIRLDARDARGELRPMIEKTRTALKARYLVVTRGRQGCVVSTELGEYCMVPAFAKKVIDRVGAGDAFLAVTSLAAAQNVSFEVLGFIGNVVGAEAVEIVGNEKAIDKLKVKKHIVSLLK